MSKVAFTIVHDHKDAALSEHFGAARWLLIHDEETAETTIEPSAGSDGRAIASMLAVSDCTDVVCAEIGPVALEILRMIEVRAWQAPLGVPASELLATFASGGLPRATPALEGSISLTDAAESERLCSGSCGGHAEDTVRVQIQ
jgi:predicted Fe-Mo cluster-binding NifX family protein